MSYVVVGCDVNNGNDSNVQNTVCKALEDNGHEVEKLAIAPGPFGKYDWGESGYNPKGKIGVYIIADGINSISDRYSNPSGFKYAYFIIRGDLDRPRMKTRHDFENNPIGADPDCGSACEKIRGKTFAQMNEIVKDKCLILFGTTAKEMADELIKAMGGDKGSSSSKSQDSGASSDDVKTCLQNLLKHWDGDVECFFRGKNVYINRVRDPEKTYTTALIEGVNVFNDGVSVTDINPNTPNHLVVDWTGGTIEFTNEILMARFGEKLKKMTAVRKVVEYYEDKSSSSDTGDSGSDSSSDTGDSDSSSGDDSKTNNNSSNTSNDDGDGRTDVGGMKLYES